MTQTVNLASGTLELNVLHCDLPLSALCGFGSRRNRKRGFLFVSKVLGKHIPVRPSQMQDIYARLAEKINAIPMEGPVVFIGLAETATALGQGVFEAALRAEHTDTLFLHSTRYRLSQPIALQFDESHSHAPRHLIYEPAATGDRALFHAARTLVIVDDEITTGHTISNLVQAYRRSHPRLRQVIVACITDWAGDNGHQALAETIDADLSIVSLLQGTYTFQGRPGFDPGPLPIVEGGGGLKDSILPVKGGRFGVRQPSRVDVDALIEQSGLNGKERVLVLGTGEFAFAPFRFALELERRGWDVHYQSTTRSPILVGGDIEAALEFVDNYGDGIPNFVYNLEPHEHVLIGYETSEIAAAHRLPELLRARALLFD